MYVIESTITINRSIEDVFEFVADSENDPQWAIPVAECIRVLGDAPKLGTQYIFSARTGPFLKKGEMETVVFEPPKRVEWQGQSLMRWKARFGFESVEGGTLLTAKTDFHGRGIFRLLESLMRSPFKKSYDKQFQNLKRILESQAD